MQTRATDLKAGFSRFLRGLGSRLHFAAHSHHLWPDVTREAHARAWSVAAELVDEKWAKSIFGELVPAVQAHVARILGLSNPATIALAPNTHELVARIFSGLPRPARVLTTDGEFHSFERQRRRWSEAGRARFDVVPVEPFASFEERFLDAAAAAEHDAVFVSHVFFRTGFVFGRFREVVQRVPRSTVVVFDGYHAFLALPTDLGDVEARAFYLAGGYKYAMSGEGACFAHCPDGYVERPVDTGWFADFDALEGAGADDAVAYGPHGQRLLGATFDPTPLFRLRAVLDWLAELGVSVEDVHAHVRRLQARFLERVAAGELAGFDAAALVPGREVLDRGHFLAFRTPAAGELHARLLERGVITDHRGDVLRLGFGVYHDEGDVDALCERIRELGRRR